MRGNSGQHWGTDVLEVHAEGPWQWASRRQVRTAAAQLSAGLLPPPQPPWCVCVGGLPVLFWRPSDLLQPALWVYAAGWSAWSPGRPGKPYCCHLCAERAHRLRPCFLLPASRVSTSEAATRDSAIRFGTVPRQLPQLPPRCLCRLTLLTTGPWAGSGHSLEGSPVTLGNTLPYDLCLPRVSELSGGTQVSQNSVSRASGGKCWQLWTCAKRVPHTEDWWLSVLISAFPASTAWLLTLNEQIIVEASWISQSYLPDYFLQEKV